MSYVGDENIFFSWTGETSREVVILKAKENTNGLHLLKS